MKFKALSLIIPTIFLIFATAKSPDIRIVLQTHPVTDAQAQPPVKIKSQGLSNVPVGQTVYCRADVVARDVREYRWSLEKPAGSRTRLSSTTIPDIRLVPDKEGQYRIKLSVIFKSGESGSVYLWLSAGFYEGDGLLFKTGKEGQCINCHPKEVKTWALTNHSLMGRDNDTTLPRRETYKRVCTFCHDEDFVLWQNLEVLVDGDPPSAGPGHPRLSGMVGVQCESCHGPGSRHLGEVGKNRIANSMNPSVCAVCHESQHWDFKFYQWSNSPHVLSMSNADFQEVENQSGCAQCHTAEGYWREILGKKESTAPYKVKAGITCATCHDPHDAEGKDSLLRAGRVEKICGGCHDYLERNDKDGFINHSQRGMILGNAGDHMGEPTMPSGKHARVEKNCVGCHMAKSPEGLGGTVGGHTFRVILRDVNKTVVNLNGCRSCHKSMSLAAVNGFQGRIREKMKMLAELLPHKSEKVIIPWIKPRRPMDPVLSDAQSRASFNYYTVFMDRSWGIHNPLYTEKLIDVSIRALRQERANAGDN